METFFTFAFGRFTTSKEFIDLIGSVTGNTENTVEKNEDTSTLRMLIVQTEGLEPANFDNLTMALSDLNPICPDFVGKTVDLVVCESVSDLKVHELFILI